MKKIPLTKGKFALVDDSDYERVNQLKWYLQSAGYAYRTICLGKERKNDLRKGILLHRFILNAPDNVCVDHINGNRLDNTRKNLRLCSRSQNQYNRLPSCRNTSGFPGVRKAKKKWIAEVYIKGKEIRLGCFSKKQDAIKARRAGELKYYGQFAPRKELLDACLLQRW